jgi:hypothetical protein
MEPPKRAHYLRFQTRVLIPTEIVCGSLLASRFAFHEIVFCSDTDNFDTRIAWDSICRADVDVCFVDDTIDVPHQSFSGFLYSPILLNAFDRFLRDLSHFFLI